MSVSADRLGKYIAPRWSCAPEQNESEPIRLDVVKDGKVIESDIRIDEQPFYILGRQPDVCHIEVLHPSISRQHVVIQHGPQARLFITDLGSTHGTMVNKKTIPAGQFLPLHVGDIIKLGQSSRLYAVEGPDRLRPAEWQTFQSPMRRAPTKAPPAPVDAESDDDEDLEEEVDSDEVDDVEEYMDTGSEKYAALSQKQKTKVENMWKRRNKIKHIDEEASILTTKLNVNGSLSQGQQAQLQRCNERAQVLRDELDNLQEEFLDSVSASKRSKKSSRNQQELSEKAQRRSKRKVDSDDDDEFYDRTTQNHTMKKKKKSRVQTLASVERQLAEVNAEASELQAKIAAFDAASTGDDDADDATALSQPLQGDSLDDYMKEMEDTLHTGARERLCARLSVLDSERDRLRRLVEFLRPAGSHLKPAAVPLSLPATTATSKPVRRSDAVPAPRHQEHKEHEEQQQQQQQPEEPSGVVGVRDWLLQQQQEQERETYALKGTDEGLQGGIVKRRKREPKAPPPPSPSPPPQEEEQEEEVEEFMANWKPPQGQSGDGRTQLNERFGY